MSPREGVPNLPRFDLLDVPPEGGSLSPQARGGAVAMALDRWSEDWMMAELRHEMAHKPGPQLPEDRQCFACLGRDGDHQPACIYGSKDG